MTNARRSRDDLYELKEFAEIQALVGKGILGRELMPEPGYWHWPILRPDELPEEFRHWINFGEVRWLCRHRAVYQR